MARGKRDLRRYPQPSARRRGNLKLRMTQLNEKRWNKACDETEQTPENIVLSVQENSSFRFAISKKDLAEAGCSATSSAYNILDDESVHNINEENPGNDCATTKNRDPFFPEGRRIIDVRHLFKTLLSHKHNTLLHGVKYTKLVGDGDSSVHRKLLQTRPYGPDVLIEKIECSNHLLRNYCAKLKDLSHRRYSSSGKAVSVTMRNVLGTNIRRLRTAVEYAAKYRRMDKTWTSAHEHLQQDIINSPNHVFGDHTHCSAYFCTGKKSGETNWIPEMKLCGLYQDIMSTLNRLALNTKSLYLNMTNNAAETYNSVVAKFSGGKRINFSRRGSYQLRCNAAALSYNAKGQMHSIIHKKITTCSPGHHTKRYVHNMVARYNKRKGAGPRMRRKLTFTSADTEYGPDAAQTVEDMTATDYALKQNQFLTKLKKSEKDIIAVERNTVGQSANHTWHEERMNRITASNFGRICKLRQSTNCSATVKSLLYSTFTGNASTRYGIAHESVAIKTFEESYNMKVESCGLFIDNKFFFLAASPDGLVGEDSIIEIKCPAKSTKLSPVDSIFQKKTNFSTYNNGKFAVKRNHNYYYQVQGQLHITKRQYCYFVFWTPLGMVVEKIEKDDNFWVEKMQNQLKLFYFDCLLPEIVDPRHPRKLPIRNPEYREKKQ